MRIDFTGNDYFGLELLSSTNSGLAYDCQLSAEMRCGAFVGEIKIWVDSAEIDGFLKELKDLDSTLHGKATLSSDDSRSLVIELSPIDSLGHFSLQVSMVKNMPLHATFLESSCVGVFALESQAMNSVYQAFAACLRPSPNA
jgi:hypothetical protein